MNIQKVNRIIGAFLLFLISFGQECMLANEQKGSIWLDWTKETGSSLWTAEVNRFDVPPRAVIEVKGPKDCLIGIRVAGDQPTSIRGTLISPNPIYVINPKGVVVGSGADINNNNNIYPCPLPLDVANQKRLIKRKNLKLSIMAAFHCARWFSAEIKEGMILKVYPKEGVTKVGEVVAKDTNGISIYMRSYEGRTGYSVILYPSFLNYSYDEIQKLEIIALTNEEYQNEYSIYGFQILPSSHPLKNPISNRHSQENKTSVDRKTEKTKKEMEKAWKMAYDFVPTPGVERPSVSVTYYSSPLDVSSGIETLHEYLWLGNVMIGGLFQSFDIGIQNDSLIFKTQATASQLETLDGEHIDFPEMKEVESMPSGEFTHPHRKR